MSSALLGTLVSGHGHRLNAAIVTFAMVWMMQDIQGVWTWWVGLLPRDCNWLFFVPSLLFWMPVRSRNCFEEPGRVLVWIVTARRFQKLYRVAYMFVGVSMHFFSK